MHFEIVSSVLHAPDRPEDAARQALMEAVTLFEQALRQRGLAAVVQVRDLRGGQTLHEAVLTGPLVDRPPCKPSPCPA